MELLECTRELCKLTDKLNLYIHIRFDGEDLDIERARREIERIKKQIAEIEAKINCN